MMEQGYLERFVLCRRAMLAGMAVWLAGWTVLLPFVPAIARFTGVELPLWWGIAIVYALDRGVRLRALYLAGIASWAFFPVHNLPLMLGGVAIAPVSLHWAMLIGTGFVAGLANGRRSAAVAGLAAAFLGVHWIATDLCRGVAGHQVMWYAHRLVLFELPLIVFGGLLADLTLRVLRGRPFGAGPSLALWALIAGLVLPRLVGLALSLIPGAALVASVSLRPVTACTLHSSPAPSSAPGTGSSRCSAAAPRASSSAPSSPSSAAR